MSYTISYTARNTGVERTSGLLYPKCPVNHSHANLTYIRRGPAFQESCPICMADYLPAPNAEKEKLVVTILPCGHYFHTSCISQINGLRCPLCNANQNEDFFAVINHQYSALALQKVVDFDMNECINMIRHLCVKTENEARTKPTFLNATILCHVLSRRDNKLRAESIRTLSDLLNSHGEYFFQILNNFLDFEKMFRIMRAFLKIGDRESTSKVIELIGNFLVSNPSFSEPKERFGDREEELNTMVDRVRTELCLIRNQNYALYHGDLLQAHNQVFIAFIGDIRKRIFKGLLQQLHIPKNYDFTVFNNNLQEIIDFLDNSPNVLNLFFLSHTSSAEIVELIELPLETESEITCFTKVVQLLTIIFTNCPKLTEEFYSLLNIESIFSLASEMSEGYWEGSCLLLKLCFAIMKTGFSSEYPEIVVHYINDETNLFIENLGIQRINDLYEENHGNDANIQSSINYWMHLIANLDNQSESLSDIYSEYTDDLGDEDRYFNVFYNNDDDSVSVQSEEGYDLEDSENSDDE